MSKNATNAQRILIVESSDTFSQILQEYLSAQGYKTHLAPDGLAGIKSVYSFLPHLVITSAQLPLFRGASFARLLKARPSTGKIPLVMFSTINETRDEFWGLQAGVDLYAEKSPENLDGLLPQLQRLLDENAGIDFEQIKREGEKISDNSIVETLDSLLDGKLFAATLSGMLARLSGKPLDDTVQGVFSLLNNVCNCEICSIMIKDGDDGLLVYNANNAGYTGEIAEDFKAIAIADFNTRFSDYKVVGKELKDFYPAGEKNKRIESYIMLSLENGDAAGASGASGESFATVHIGTSVKEYFSPVVLQAINVFLSAASGLVANALRHRLMENRQKKTMTAFARYVPIDVMDEIIKKSSSQATHGETRLVAVLFSDIRSFTTISENTPAQELVEFLNGYFDLMGRQIISEGGNIDKFIGDAIMAIFGAPKTLENASTSAVRAALRMVKTLGTVDTSGIFLPQPGLGTGIGVNYGECVVGNIGFQNKLDYTVIGDTVNLAARLEGVTKYYSAPVIVSEFVYNVSKDDFIFRKADSVRVKGKDRPVGLYTVYEAWQGEAEEGTPQSLVISRETLDQYNKGLKLYYMREWETAKQYFNNALEASRAAGKEDYLCELYLHRIADYQVNPPPADWDTTTTMTEK
ncbi:MAG: response regulator [Spirochaetes bacterium]|nr:response regulator [Spirochaetota bacterium]